MRFGRFLSGAAVSAGRESNPPWSIPFGCLCEGRSIPWRREALSNHAARHWSPTSAHELITKQSPLCYDFDANQLMKYKIVGDGGHRLYASSRPLADLLQRRPLGINQ